MKSFSLTGLLRGLVVSLAIVFSAAALLSFVSLKTNDPSKYLPLFSGMVPALAVFFGACAASKNNRFLTGLALGIVVLAIHKIVGSVWFESDGLTWIKAVIIALSAVAGSMFHKKSGNSASSDRRRKIIRRRYSAY